MFSFLSASEYVGLDSNPEYTLRARRLYPNAQFVCQSVTEYKVPQSEYFDLVLALGIVHHLEDSEAVQLFRIAQTALKPEGRLITLDGIWLPNQSWFSKFLLRIDRGTFVRGEKEYIELALTSFSKIKPTVRHDLLRIPYSHLILECTR
jgi:SAM-dependent methyltransferase